MEKRVFHPDEFIERGVYNRNLKEIARLEKIDKNIISKIARHTNGQLWIRYHAERPVVSTNKAPEKVILISDNSVSAKMAIEAYISLFPEYV